MNTFYTYLPQDRLRALAQGDSLGETLPDRCAGAALFADIAGFTAFTEKLTRQLGHRRGAEVLTQQLNAVYTALIAEVERFGGSVIDFAGDAILCWFDDKLSTEDGQPQMTLSRPSAFCAAAAALAMQAAMAAFPDLALRVSIASGPARRFVIGDPSLHLLDVLVGDTIGRVASGNPLTQKGEVLVDEATALALGDASRTSPPGRSWRPEWRASAEFRFAVLDPKFGFGDLHLSASNPAAAPSDLNPETLRPFILPRVFEQEASGESPFLTEFRPCVGLFVRFAGIDYNADQTQVQLDAFIRLVQAVVARSEGTLLQLTIGDKGSFLYINFGVFVAHEDDASRALKTALELRAVSPLPLQMGVTRGVMRVGAYGSDTRRTYGAISDDVNLAARLMQAAAVGEILVNDIVQRAAQRRFVFEARGLLHVKGKASPTPAFAALSESPPSEMRLQEPTYVLPMVGRQAELQTIAQKLDLVLQGQSQGIGIVGEAGVGKSRLAAEAIRCAREKGLIGYGSACQSEGIHTPYLVWKPIWSALFELDPQSPLEEQIHCLEKHIEAHAPSRRQALPLLDVLLGVNIPGNAFTKSLDPKTRQSALHALLEDYLKSAARETPLILLLEDLHWIDELSRHLLEGLATALARYPVCFLLVYRPSQAEIHNLASRLSQFTQIALTELNPADSGQVLRARLAQLYPGWSGEPPPQLIAKLIQRAEGNPFYLEELLNYLHDRRLDLSNADVVEQIELPDSLHTLILSRIDQLRESEKNALRAASIVGRLFYAQWLNGYCPELGDWKSVLADLEQLAVLDITPVYNSASELAYLFKHIITHEATYESLLYTTRARLHERLAQYLESVVGARTPNFASLLDLITFHYGRSENIPKQREYFRKAGEAAEAAFSRPTALMYYERLLQLVDEPGEKLAVYVKIGKLCDAMVLPERTKAAQRAILSLAEVVGGREAALAAANARLTLGKACRESSDYDDAQRWLDLALRDWAALDDQTGVSKALGELGRLHVMQGNYRQACQELDEALRCAGADRDAQALALIQAGHVAFYHADYDVAQSKYERTLALREEVNDLRGIVSAIGNLGALAMERGEYAAGQALTERSLEISRELGDKPSVAIFLLNLGELFMAQGDFSAAQAALEQSLMLSEEINNKWCIFLVLIYLGSGARDRGDCPTARARIERALAIARETGDKIMIAHALCHRGLTILAQGEPGAAAEARQNILASLHLRRELQAKTTLASNLIALAGLALYEGDARRAARLLGAIDAIIKTLGLVIEIDLLFVHPRFLASTRAALSEEEFAAAWAEGQKIAAQGPDPLEGAIAYALEDQQSEHSTPGKI